MNPLGLALAQLKDRWVASALHVAMLAIGVAAATALLLFSVQSDQRLQRDARGVDLVVGPKGSPLQLVLSSVFHADVPAGNIPYEAVAQLDGDRRVRDAIPLGLGDTVGGFRIVGTRESFVALYGAELSAGRMMAAEMEAVLGAEVAARLGLSLGDRFVGAHGLGEGGAAHEGHDYTVVGILAPTGAVIDRLAITPLESVWAVHDHGPIEGVIGGRQTTAPATPSDDYDHDHDHGDHDHAHDHDHDHGPGEAHDHEDRPKEVTAILLRLNNPIAAPILRREINQRTAWLAARPADEATRLFALIGTGTDLLRAFAFLFIGAAALSVFATLLSALNERRGEVALLRAMGATRGDVFGVLIGQGLVIASVGTLMGLALGHGLIHVLAQASAQARGFGLDGSMVHPGEVWILAGGLAAGLLAALPPAIGAYRTDIAKTLAEAG